MTFKYLRILFFASIITILYVEFSPFRIPEIFYNTADKLNDIISRLCYAYMGSFIFYYLVVYLKRKRDSENISEFVSNCIKYMYYNYKYLIDSLQPDKKNMVEFPDVKKLKYLFNSINPNCEAPLLMGVNNKRADWFEFLDYVLNTHHNHLNKLQTLMPHLPTELIKILAKSDFRSTSNITFTWFKSWQNANMQRYTNLEFAAGTLFGYVESIRSLKKYHEKTYGEIKLKA